MDEQPRQPVERREVVERHETIERDVPETAPPRRSLAWVWVLLLVLLIGALAWYALSRGEPQELEVPEVEAPDIEINAPDGGGGA